MKQPADIDRPEIVEEIQQCFERYETALMQNDIEALDAFFWQSAQAIRFGTNENLYGIEAIRAFRRQRCRDGLDRRLENTKVHTFGQDFAITTTEFKRPEHPLGRQTQIWARFSEGWRIVSAHVSLIQPA